MALPPGGKAAPAGAGGANLYEELGDSSMAKKSVIEEADHQRNLSTFACRAFAAHSNGALHVNLPKSESNVTYLSDRNPLTTHNPVYRDNSLRGSPPEKRFSFSMPHSEWPGCAWTMPARIHAESYEAPRRQALMDPADWEVQILRATMRESKSSEVLPLSGRSETRLSVREQARHFEQQALVERALMQNTQGSLSPILVRDQDGTDVLEVTSNTLLSIMDYPSSFGRDVPPNIIITQGDESWPVPSQRSTPPVLKKFGSSISNYMTVQPCQIHVEIIPDPPENPPPPLPERQPSSPSLSSSSDPPSFSPSPPNIPKLNHQASPPPSPPNEPVFPPPPPPLPPPSPPINQIRPVGQFVPTSLPPVSSLRPVSERKLHSPPVTPRTDSDRKELRGILRNLQNLADIERSVANLYSQVDRNCKVPRFKKKPQVTEWSEGANTLQDSDLGGERSTPKPDTPSSAVQISSGVKSAEVTESGEDVADEVHSSNAAELSELSSSQTTVF
ncbi:protocadherin-15-like [Entelurus aequoreus]|uniref:protocadherin-15-like n=1 Tax=Entelurus aequoreus TaxID=161455 RepID=UPI002B1D733F|nr:protocadherin-15-like [Entelurus aequoreus]